VERSKYKWITHVEEVLVRLIIVFMSTLLLSQLLLLKEGTRIYLSKVDKMEGEDLSFTIPLYADTPLQITDQITVLKSYQNLLRRSKTIEIKNVTRAYCANAFIVINGKKIADLSKGNSQITVYDGDYIEIDVTAVDIPVQFVIKTADKGLLSPQDGLVVEGAKTILAVGKIKFNTE